MISKLPIGKINCQFDLPINLCELDCFTHKLGCFPGHESTCFMKNGKKALKEKLSKIDFDMYKN